ncbi:MAG: hypothetical protein ACLR4Z_06215 [Butyricicoccaceae bacterium]
MDGSVRKMLELSRLETGVQALRREGIPACRPRAGECACRRAPGRRQSSRTRNWHPTTNSIGQRSTAHCLHGHWTRSSRTAVCSTHT